MAGDGGDSGRGAGRWLGVALLVAVVGAVAFYIHRNVLIALDHIDAGHSDFAHYHQAARAVLAGESPFVIHNYDYPPLVAMLVLPLAPLAYVGARLLWFWFSHLFLLGAGALLWPRLGGDRCAAVVVVVVWAFAGTVAENLVLGQINPALLLLVVVAMFASRGEHVNEAGMGKTSDAVAACAVGLAAGLKLWPAVLLAGPAVAGRWRVARIGAGVAALLVVVPMVVVLLFLPEPHVPQSAGFWMGTPAFLNVSVPATLLRLADFPLSDAAMPPAWLYGNDPRAIALTTTRAVLSVASAAVILACGLLVVARAAHRGRVDPVPVLAALVALALVAAPISWYHYQLLQLPGFAWLGVRCVRRRSWRRLAGLALLVWGLTWAHSSAVVTFGLVDPLDPIFVLVRGAVVAAFGLVLFAGLVRECVES